MAEQNLESGTRLATGMGLVENPTEAPPPCLALRPKQAAQALGIGARKLWELTADQTSGIPHVRFGKAVVYPVRELRDWLGQQASKDGNPR